MTRHVGRRVTHAVVLLTLSALLATGCTGSSHGASVAHLSATATNTSAAGNSPSAAAESAGPLAFARCMRANGLPNWPDPEGNGEFDKAKLRATGYSTTQIRAVEDGPCKNTLPTGSPSAQPSPTISVQQQQDYINAVACMRAHGITNFPDPTFSGGHVTLVPPPGLDTNSTPFTQAQHICQQLIPSGLPYSGSK